MPDGPQIVRLAVSAMGTRFEIVLVGDDESFLRSVGEEMLDEVGLWDARLSLFRRDSLVSDINANAHLGPVRLDDETFSVLEQAVRLHGETGGAFDPTVGGLMREWGFRGESADGSGGVGMDLLRLNAADRTVRFAQPGPELDFGAIGKGIALDRAASIARGLGIRVALLHGGTSCAVALGAPPGQHEGWKIRIATPDGRGPDVTLRDRALAVSAQHGRVVRHGDGIVGHVMDPRTRAPVDRAGVCVVTGESAAEADAWSTALLVYGAKPPVKPAGLDWFFVAPSAAGGAGGGFGSVARGGQTGSRTWNRTDGHS